jgi:hypothetical protein
MCQPLKGAGGKFILEEFTISGRHGAPNSMHTEHPTEKWWRTAVHATSSLLISFIEYIPQQISTVRACYYPTQNSHVGSSLFFLQFIVPSRCHTAQCGNIESTELSAGSNAGWKAWQGLDLIFIFNSLLSFVKVASNWGRQALHLNDLIFIPFPSDEWRAGITSNGHGYRAAGLANYPMTSHTHRNHKGLCKTIQADLM